MEVVIIEQMKRKPLDTRPSNLLPHWDEPENDSL